MRNTVELVPLTYADMNISKPQQQKKHAHHHTVSGAHLSGVRRVPVPTSGTPRCGSSLMRTPAGPERMWLQPKYIVSHCQTPRQKENKAPPFSTRLPGRLYASVMCRCFRFLISVLFSFPLGCMWRAHITILKRCWLFMYPILTGIL